MALWQFDILFVPPGAGMPVCTADGCRTNPLDSERCEIAKTALSAQFGAGHEVMEGWVMYGPEQGSRFDLLLDEDKTGELSARVDARAKHDQFLESVCRLAQEIECSLYSLQFGQMLEPSLTALRQALLLSRASAFVRSPLNTLIGRSDA
ncbi:hypothetical protein D621_21800 [beta proteobacterium AAP51]|nr:hypothetical protein D621_21800 [beta proteobacterium AAP51]